MLYQHEMFQICKHVIQNLLKRKKCGSSNSSGQRFSSHILPSQLKTNKQTINKWRGEKKKKKETARSSLRKNLHNIYMRYTVELQLWFNRLNCKYNLHK